MVPSKLKSPPLGLKPRDHYSRTYRTSWEEDSYNEPRFVLMLASGWVNDPKYPITWGKDYRILDTAYDIFVEFPEGVCITDAEKLDQLFDTLKLCAKGKRMCADTFEGCVASAHFERISAQDTLDVDAYMHKVGQEEIKRMRYTRKQFKLRDMARKVVKFFSVNRDTSIKFSGARKHTDDDLADALLARRAVIDACGIDVHDFTNKFFTPDAMDAQELLGHAVTLRRLKRICKLYSRRFERKFKDSQHHGSYHAAKLNLHRLNSVLTNLSNNLEQFERPGT